MKRPQKALQFLLHSRRLKVVQKWRGHCPGKGRKNETGHQLWPSDAFLAPFHLVTVNVEAKVQHVSRVQVWIQICLALVLGSVFTIQPSTDYLTLFKDLRSFEDAMSVLSTDLGIWSIPQVVALHAHLTCNSSSALAPRTFWATQWLLRDFPVHRRVVSSLSGLYLLDANQLPFLLMWKPTSPDIGKHPLRNGGKKSPVAEDHCLSQSKFVTIRITPVFSLTCWFLSAASEE
jgi:hypothetical protein